MLHIKIFSFIFSEVPSLITEEKKSSSNDFFSGNYFLDIEGGEGHQAMHESVTIKNPQKEPH